MQYPKIDCSKIIINNCNDLINYATCLDTETYSRYYTIYNLFPNNPRVAELFSKYSSGMYSIAAGLCNPSTFEDVKNTIYQLNLIENMEYQILMDNLIKEQNNTQKTNRWLLIGAGLGIFYFAVRNYTLSKILRKIERGEIEPIKR